MIQHRGERHGNAIRRRLASKGPDGARAPSSTLPVIARAKGSALWTVGGRKLTDFASGHCVANLGHGHTAFERRCRELVKGMPRNAYGLSTELEVQAMDALLRSMKGNPNAEKVLWAATGADGIHKAMMAALRFQPDRHIIVATRGGFHGKKGLAGDVSGNASDNPNVRWLSFPQADVEPRANYRKKLDRLAADHPGDIALFITEPYLGAAGSYHPPKWYHQMIQAWCNKHGIPFIFDEIQSCHGRTGNMYAYETYGVTPDLVALGKGLGNGEPVAAVAGRADILDALEPGDASDTFSGNPRACAAVLAALEIFKSEGIVRQAKARAVELRSMLDALKSHFAFIKAVRGEGMVYGIEVTNGAVANQCVLEAYLGNGKKGVHFIGPLAGNVLRVSPPLVINAKELDEAYRLLRDSWSRVDPTVGNPG